jgi:hypothetical protein
MIHQNWPFFIDENWIVWKIFKKLENTKTSNLINLNQQELTEIKRNQIKSKAQT